MLSSSLAFFSNVSTDDKIDLSRSMCVHRPHLAQQFGMSSIIRSRSSLGGTCPPYPLVDSALINYQDSCTLYSAAPECFQRFISSG